MKIITVMHIEFEESIPDHMESEIKEIIKNEEYLLKSKQLLIKAVKQQLKSVVRTVDLKINVDFILDDTSVQ